MFLSRFIFETLKWWIDFYFEPFLSNDLISILEQTSTRLDINAVPDSLPCRESEYQNIFTFIEDKINHNTGGCLYISGVPGTGKTATTQEVVAALREEVNQGMKAKIINIII